MMRLKKFCAVTVVALSVLVAFSPAALGAVTFGLRASGYTTSGTVVYVSVTNGDASTLSGTVAVTASVNGLSLTAFAPCTVPGGTTATVPVALPGAPSNVTSCGMSNDSPTPFFD